MSFGFSVGDVFVCSKAAYSAYTALKNAPEEFAELSLEVLSLNQTLHALSEEASSPSSIILLASPQRQESLRLLLDNCRKGLTQLELLVVKSKSLGASEKTRFLEHVRFAAKGKQGPRDKLAIHTASINIFLTSLTHSSLGRLELLIRNAINGTALTISPDQEIWSSISKDLAINGIDAKDVDRLRHEIVAYTRHLVKGGEPFWKKGANVRPPRPDQSVGSAPPAYTPPSNSYSQSDTYPSQNYASAAPPQSRPQHVPHSQTPPGQSAPPARYAPTSHAAPQSENAGDVVSSLPYRYQPETKPQSSLPQQIPATGQSSGPQGRNSAPQGNPFGVPSSFAQQAASTTGSTPGINTKPDGRTCLDENANKSRYSFGTPGSGSAGRVSGSVSEFGQLGQSSSIFGGANSSGAGTPGTPSSNVVPKPLFGNTSGNLPAMGKGLFGSAPMQQDQASKPSFGDGFGSNQRQQQQSQVQPNGSSDFFGSHPYPASTNASGGLFGNAQQQPASTQSGSLFGSVGGQPILSGGLFGSAQPTESAEVVELKDLFDHMFDLDDAIPEIVDTSGGAIQSVELLPQSYQSYTSLPSSSPQQTYVHQAGNTFTPPTPYSANRGSPYITQVYANTLPAEAVSSTQPIQPSMNPSAPSNADRAIRDQLYVMITQLRRSQALNEYTPTVEALAAAIPDRIAQLRGAGVTIIQCDLCHLPIEDYHYHCDVCANGDWDACSFCIDQGKKCAGRHVLSERSGRVWGGQMYWINI
ncbi:hypothetical protein EJ08DRAFT_482486 [Tothia fuscella]|uniref:Uncharacterized protein n=1 Tax=Tothia fuscella TaxID=1048955 RepID=A0A9P4TTY8_9PEZI|nr:hypothetical protein EJ08DRAFT_482486 [Tothia fuscella]